MPHYQTVLGVVMMSERRGLFCRYECISNGMPWAAHPKTESSWEDMKAAIALRDAHEVREHGALFLVFSPDAVDPFNSTFVRKTKR